MKADLSSELRSRLRGRVAVVGVGNPALGDDGAGVALARALREAGCAEAIEAGTVPEHWMGKLAGGACDTVLFLDAVRMGAAPGSAALLDAAQIESRFPQVSTHKISLGLLARMIEREGRARALLLGIEPGAIEGEGLSPAVRGTVEALAEMLAEALGLETLCTA